MACWGKKHALSLLLFILCKLLLLLGTSIKVFIEITSPPFTTIILIYRSEWVGKEGGL